MARVSVASFAELKAAVEDSTSTEIVVTADIVYTGGAKVNLTKGNIVIDFAGHKVTDSSSLNVATTIYVPSTTNTISVTAKNAVWDGKNYYGVIGVYDGNVNTTITLQNITYTGPQFVYNKNGITNINNCTVTLDKNNSSTTAQEFCEANRVNISGKVKVISNSTSNAVIWFTGANAALTIATNANFDVTANSTYFLYTDVSQTMLFNQNSTTNITTRNGLFYASGNSSHIAASFTLEENASFIAYKLASNSVPMFKCVSNFTLKNNSIFKLYSEVSSTAALMYFGQVANINITSPQNVVLYNVGGNVFSFGAGSTTNPNKINIKAEMLRLWNTAKTPLASAGGFDDKPTTEYYKAGYASNLNLEITATNSQLITTTNNLTSGDTGYPISTSTLKLLTSKVISMGKMSISANEITDQSLTISGTTNNNANVMAEYNDKSKVSIADSAGGYTLNLSETIAKDTSVKISANRDFLTKWITTTVEGSVAITKISALKFYAFTTQPNQKIINRQQADWNIEITDTRTAGGDWYLYAHILNPLASGENNLDNVLIYKKDDVNNILTDTPLLVYSGRTEGTNEVTTITWADIEGFLLQLEENTIYPAGDYQTEIMWQVSTKTLEQ